MISNPYEGIYYISGDTVLFPTQLIISKELDKERHVWLTSLTEDMPVELVAKYTGLTVQTIEEIRKNL